MRFRDASKLHKGDEVIIKTTGESRYVLYVMTLSNGKLMIDTCKSLDRYDGDYRLYFHTEVK